MTFTWKCYQDNFLFNNFNIRSFGDCFGSIIACIALALLIELGRGIDLYLRHELSNTNNAITARRNKRWRRIFLQFIQSSIHLLKLALSYLLMMIVMSNFVGYIVAATIGLGIGYYLLNGVHPYTRSLNDPTASSSTQRLAPVNA